MKSFPSGPGVYHQPGMKPKGVWRKLKEKIWKPKPTRQIKNLREEDER